MSFPFVFYWLWFLAMLAALGIILWFMNKGLPNKWHFPLATTLPKGLIQTKSGIKAPNRPSIFSVGCVFRLQECTTTGVAIHKKTTATKETTQQPVWKKWNWHLEKHNPVLRRPLTKAGDQTSWSVALCLKVQYVRILPPLQFILQKEMGPT